MNPYKKNTKIYDLYEEIKKVRLNKLFIPNDDINNDHSVYFRLCGIEHLHKCVRETNKFPFVNEYIHEYLNLFPHRIDHKSKGCTALMIAITKLSSIETVKILLEHGANVNTRDTYDKTVLMYASKSSKKNNTEDIVKLLLKYKADVNMQDAYGETALLLSTIYSNTYSSKETVEELLKHGANPNIADYFGTPLVWCIEKLKETSSKEVIKILVKYNADVEYKCMDKYCNSFSAVTQALYKCRKDVTYDLLPNRLKFIDSIISNSPLLRCIHGFYGICDFKLMVSTIYTFRELIIAM